MTIRLIETTPQHVPQSLIHAITPAVEINGIVHEHQKLSTTIS